MTYESNISFTPVSLHPTLLPQFSEARYVLAQEIKAYRAQLVNNRHTEEAARLTNNWRLENAARTLYYANSDALAALRRVSHALRWY